MFARAGERTVRLLKSILFSEKGIDSTTPPTPGLSIPLLDCEFIYDPDHVFVFHMNSYHPSQSRYPPPSSLSNNTMRAPPLILKQRISIIPCKKYDKVDTRALMPKSYQTHCVCKDFNIKTLNNKCFFSHFFCKFPARALLLKS